jgi:hypothetical protein
MLLRALGEEEADRVYPQMKSEKLSAFSENIASKIELVAMELISDKGWVTEKEIVSELLDRFGGYKEVTSKQIKKMLGEMLAKYDLKRERLNKKLKEKYNIDMDSYPFVIFKE